MLRYYTDGKRHLVCMPYSKENLHKMALDLGLSRCWFHRGKYPHYDIPINRQVSLECRCILVSPKDIIKICRGDYIGKFENIL